MSRLKRNRVVSRRLDDDGPFDLAEHLKLIAAEYNLNVIEAAGLWRFRIAHDEIVVSNSSGSIKGDVAVYRDPKR